MPPADDERHADPAAADLPSDPLFQQGVECVKRGDLKEALRAFEQGGHLRHAAKAAERLGNPGKAIDLFLQAKSYIEAAQVCLVEEDFGRAAELFAQGKDHRGAARAHEALLAAKFDLAPGTPANPDKIPRKAKELIKEAVGAYSRSGAHGEAAAWTLQLGDKLRAARFLDLAKEHTRAAALYAELGKEEEAGRAWLSAGQFLPAAEAFKRGKKFAEAAAAYERGGDMAAAVECYRAGKHHDLAAKLWIDRGNYEAAAAIFEEGRDFYQAAVLYHKCQKFDKVISCAEQLPKKDDRYAKVCQLLIHACLQLREVTFRSDDYVKEFVAATPSPQQLDLLYRFAGLYDDLEFHESAQEILQKIRAADPSFRDVAQRLQLLEAKTRATPMAVRKILEEDFGYAATSERLAGYQSPSGEGGEPAPAPPSAAADGLAAAPAAAVDFTAGAILFDRYKIKKVLGRGRTSTVCQVIDREIEDELALKVLDPQAARGPGLEQFKKEIKLARRLKHPNIVSIFDYGKKGEHHYITMEVVSGQSLRARLDAEGPVSADKGLRLLRALASGLGAIHELGIVHRDVNPFNILIDDKGEVKILDFGLAKSDDLSRSPERAAENQEMLQRLAYLAPEQIRGEALDPRADIYSIGAVAYEIFTGRPPFQGTQWPILLQQCLEKPPAPPREFNASLPEKLQNWILNCLEKQPAARPSSCSDMLAALDPAADKGGAEGRASAKVSQVINGRYLVKKMIGRGGMGVGLCAFDESLQREVASNSCPTRTRGQPGRPAQVPQRGALRGPPQPPQHRHHPQHRTAGRGVFHRHGIHRRPRPAQPAQGERLPAPRQPGPGLPPGLRSAAYAHKHKVFHRDIKSANILWTNDSGVKITDFGLAKIAEGAVAASTRMHGSPEYISPEQILGQNVDHRTDIYSLGATLYELATGATPFRGKAGISSTTRCIPRPIRRRRLGRICRSLWSRSSSSACAKSRKSASRKRPRSWPCFPASPDLSSALLLRRQRAPLFDRRDVVDPDEMGLVPAVEQNETGIAVQLVRDAGLLSAVLDQERSLLLAPVGEGQEDGPAADRFAGVLADQLQLEVRLDRDLLHRVLAHQQDLAGGGRRRGKNPRSFAASRGPAPPPRATDSADRGRPPPPPPAARRERARSAVSFS